MKQNKIIAITGGIGSGKSTVLNMIRDFGGFVLSADGINAELLTFAPYVQKIAQAFPTAVVDGKIDKRILGAIVFADKEKLDLLNAIARPALLSLIEKKIIQAAKENEFVFVECPLLFEWGLQDRFDKIIVVKAGESERMQRVKQRDGRSEEQIAAIMKEQASDNDRVGQKCLILNNDGDLNELSERLNEILRQIKFI